MTDIKPSITTQMHFNCSREKIFDFVTIPDNWVGTHPATKDVEGDSHSPAVVGKCWIEIIDPVWRNDGEAIGTEWEALAYEYPSLWTIRAINVMNTSATVYITYKLSEEDGGTLFQRIMSVEMEDKEALSVYAKDLQNQREMQNQYLLSLKNRLEA